MKRTVFISLACVALATASGAVGLQLAPYVAKQLGFAPFKHAAASGDGCVAAAKQLIEHAVTSIALSAETINNRTLLEALAGAKERGVTVGVVLSGTNADNQSVNGVFHGARAWLADHHVPCYVSDDTRPVKGTTLVVDRLRVLESPFPILSSGEYVRQKAQVFVFEHRATAETYFNAVAGLTSR